MKIDTLLEFLVKIDNDNYEVVQGMMLTMLDPSGRTNTQIPIELVALIAADDEEMDDKEEFVVISLILTEDATWFKKDSFDEDITVWEDVQLTLAVNSVKCF